VGKRVRWARRNCSKSPDWDSKKREEVRKEIGSPAVEESWLPGVGKKRANRRV